MSTPLIIESWVWYGVVVLMITLRFTSRFMLFRDIRKFQIEDWFMLFVFSLYTVLIIFLNICSDVSTNLINPDDIPSLTPEDIRDRVYGSKCVLVVESMMCAVQWGTKACMLMLYYRLTENLRQRIVVQIAAVYCVVSYIVMISLYYGYWCRPFKAFWETPTPNIQCATQIHHLIVNLTFNLTSDLMIIFIPLPMFIKAHLDLKKKLLLVFPFSLGFFTMICAILSKHLSFTQPFSSEWLFWYTRESSTAMIVSNMPYSWTVIRRVFHVKAFLRPGSDTNIGRTVSGRNMSSTVAPQLMTPRGSDAIAVPTKSFSISTPFSKRPSLPRYVSNTQQSFQDTAESKGSFDMVSWKRSQGPDGKGDFLSTASSDESTAKSVKSAGFQPPISDVDRLYRLDDDDLEMEVARIRQDSLTHLRLQQSLEDESDQASSASADSSEFNRRPVSKRKVSKEQSHRILRETARKHSEPFPEEIAKALEKSQFDTSTSQDVRESVQIDSTSTVTPDEEEANTNTSNTEAVTSQRLNRKNKGSSSARPSSNKLIRDTRSPSLSRPLSPMRPTSLLIASLGNPPPYHSTRHSAAHIILKHLQATLNLPPFTLKSRPYGGGHVSTGADVGRPELTLWQSPSLMNVSGPPLLKAWKNFVTVQSVSPTDPITGLIVLHDEMETESGKVKVKRGNTSARGHNGIKSVQSSLQSAGLMQTLGDRYVKIGIGIGRPGGGSRDTRDVSAYVLGQLTAREREGLENATSDLAGVIYQEMARIGQSAA